MALKRKTDEQDSTTAVWWNYGMAVFVTGGIFLVDIFVDKGLLDGAMIGILISKVYDGITKQNDYYFPTTSRNSKSPEPELEPEKPVETPRSK